MKPAKKRPLRGLILDINEAGILSRLIFITEAKGEAFLKAKQKERKRVNSFLLFTVKITAF
jgi:hypothetical protein